MGTIVEEKWDEILEFLRTEYDVSPVSYRMWLQPLKVHKVDDSRDLIIFSVDDQLVGQLGIKHIETKYVPFLSTAIAEFTNKFYNLEFMLSSQIEQQKREEEAAMPKSRGFEQEKPFPSLNPKYTFDTFVPGPNNKFALAASLAVAESPAETYNPLFIYGGAGLGKTHLMNSIARYIIDHNPKAKVIFTTSEIFTNELIESIRAGAKNNANKNNEAPTTEFRRKYRNVDVLLIDDIQFIIGKESTQEEFFHTFNTLYEAKKQIVISSDKPPRDMAMLEERLRSRFDWGLTVDIQQPDYETRMAILQKRRDDIGAVKVTDEILDYIAKNVKSNIRDLEGSLNRVNAFSSLQKRELTLELAQEALKDTISTDGNKIVTVDHIVDIVAEHFNITQNDIYSNSRSRNVAYPRQIAMYLSKKLTTNSVTDIGKFLGNRDHSTIIHGYDKIESDLATNKNNIKNTIDVLIKKINPVQ
ncbi:MAG: chromosomal replication initiator protein DnaA [Lachnospiraceae bacterium]|nr:chromosomal replication initiator protein DnaA [Lachnospiraceae bacterium]